MKPTKKRKVLSSLPDRPFHCDKSNHRVIYTDAGAFPPSPRAVLRPATEKEFYRHHSSQYWIRDVQDLMTQIKLSIGCQNKDCRWHGDYVAKILEFHHFIHKHHSPGRTTAVWPTIHELSKCMVLCRNCHTMHHDRGKLWNVTPEDAMSRALLFATKEFTVGHYERITEDLVAYWWSNEPAQVWVAKGCSLSLAA